ncbi:MAG: N-acetyl-gamma-glutamyl-phosphate reductase [Chloroflexota bacterium]|jgi:N-acetyl-gamma-glutamyl-phosphate reductase|nr:N-acetyl-gamma-glutamyl-phosphate reductase [Dehalococcoidia bacterium]MED5207735.1 N-acetyl-gamma-glutamyl-phosphate reductase [Chloroflexota bacterium]MEE3012546.1 N-acetyl-gamma-glutamyl-phosphate reductase [Chloroflexota bacterium]GIS94272.1 MAG: N-acetyl-gamma-glutamyl-phosphate reductase [Dehalococcoidia bacterium]|tara:strand:- start:2576 stop:3607 length:1032 start_codon:yes stop_codon:yes gene_type:complete
MKIGIINITGYAGSELARILYRHPNVEITSVTGRSAAGQQLNEVFPHLTAMNMPIEEELSGSLDLVFSALPHKASAEACIPVLEQGVKVVDISADFRLKQADEYTEWYGVDHPDPTYLEEAVYGLTELHRDDVSTSRLVANPGCYPTSAILGLAPAVTSKIITQDIIVDSKSGVSGGGRSLTLTNHFSEVNENVFAYALNGHRHLPEITQELAPLADKVLNLTFLTHLIPMTRGILSSCYATLTEPTKWVGSEGREKIINLYRDYYADDPFVRVVPTPPQTKQTLGNNLCLIHPSIDERTGRLIVISCLDNLVKGAAGQAVQNMNLMCGFPEETGLEALAVYP